MEKPDMLVLILMGTAIVLLVLWALLGPRRRADESGPHVDLAEETRRRDTARKLGREEQHHDD